MYSGSFCSRKARRSAVSSSAAGTCGHHVGHEALVARRVLAHHDHGLTHLGVLLQRGLDLAQLDAEAAHLHLEVQAAQVLDVAVGQPARHVARAVEARAGLGAEGVGDEALGGELGAAEVAAADLHAADEELARARPRAPAAGARRACGWPVLAMGRPMGMERRPSTLWQWKAVTSTAASVGP